MDLSTDLLNMTVPSYYEHVHDLFWAAARFSPQIGLEAASCDEGPTTQTSDELLLLFGSSLVSRLCHQS